MEISLLESEKMSYFSPNAPSFSSWKSPGNLEQPCPSSKHGFLTPPIALPAKSSSTLDWRDTMHQVKQKYLARKYRSCSLQCCEILDNLEDLSAIEPLHLTYLHFYAASSFEWCARSLSSSSAYRTKLLSSAQKHYGEVDALIEATEWNMAERARSPFFASMTTPSSPGFSACSIASEESSAPSSPRTSVFSFDDEIPPMKPTQTTKPKIKKVSFSDLPELIECQPEPYVRPDSPTLGWDWDHHADSGMEAHFPMPPRTGSPISIMKFPLEEKPVQPPIMSIADILAKAIPRATTAADILGQAKQVMTNTAQEYDQERNSTPSNHDLDSEPFLQEHTLHRFHGKLSALRDQVSRHRAAVDRLLDAENEDAITPTTPLAKPVIISPEASRPHTPCETFLLSTSTSTPTLQQPASPTDAALGQASPSLAERRNSVIRLTLRIQTDVKAETSGSDHHAGSQSAIVSGLACEYTPGTPPDLLSRPTSAAGGEKTIQERIEWLRANGWKRKRFDGRRYEALRECVLGELADRD
ncbi:hypothetical protein F4777DRAFT_58529 [Nemania sp. FL0916]|nr:hypothetical protein F4777DRAFT_58529 [Nemania sp. FL0916]